jgi:hypothetical protein
MQGNARGRGLTRRSWRAGVVVALLAAVCGICSPSAFADEPTVGPTVDSVTTSGSVLSDDLVAFAGRGVVRVEGFTTRVGQTGVVEVSRGGRLVASARGVVSGRGVAFTVGAPGGPCWSTPTDLRPGDQVTLAFGPARVAQTVVGAAALGSAPVLTGTTVQVAGRVDPAADPNLLEQRIVAPGLTGTTVGRSDVRALPGAMHRAARGGYSSQLTVAGPTVTATYVFDDPATAAVAAGGAARMLSWQAEGPAGDRHGQTVTEPTARPAVCPAPAPAAPATPTASVTADGVVLAPQPGTDVYFTVDGTSPRLLDLPAAGAARYVPPIVVTHPATTIAWVAVGADGATSEVGSTVVDPPPRR